MSKFSRLGKRGDTIVEVMICLAVISFIISISYATATRGLKQSRQSQERVEAAKILESQIEQIRAKKPTPLTGTRCFTQTGNWQVFSVATRNCRHNNLYDVRVVHNASLYTVTVTWDNATGRGQDRAVMYYRMYP